MESEETHWEEEEKGCAGIKGREEIGRGGMDEWERKEGGEEGSGKERARGVGGGLMMN